MRFRHSSHLSPAGLAFRPPGCLQIAAIYLFFNSESVVVLSYQRADGSFHPFVIKKFATCPRQNQNEFASSLLLGLSYLET